METATLELSNIKFLRFILPHQPAGVAHHVSVTLGAPLRAQEQPKKL